MRDISTSKGWSSSTRKRRIGSTRCVAACAEVFSSDESYVDSFLDTLSQANNEDSGPDEVDLHGLYTAEAITRTEQEIAARQRRGDASVRIIVGKGIHSKDHVAHIKPAIEDLMRKYNLQAHLDPKNSGVLVVDLTGKAGGAFNSDVGGFTRGLAQNASGNDEQVSDL